MAAPESNYVHKTKQKILVQEQQQISATTIKVETYYLELTPEVS